jgi:hypothetical protein
MSYDEIQVHVWQLAQDQADRDVLLLRDDAGRHLPIWIGECEATSINLKLQQHRLMSFLRRPMTHDLLAEVIHRLGASLLRVLIDDYWNGTYYAKLYLRLNGEEIAVDCRPSDAIALAVRTDAPIFVTKPVMAVAEQLVDVEEPDPELDSDRDEQ